MDNKFNKDDIKKALGTVIEPELHKDLITLDMVKDIEIKNDEVSFTIMLTTPACPLKHQMENDCKSAIEKMVEGVKNIEVAFDSNVRADSRIKKKLDLNIKNIIAVSSGKGGVGKSTVSVNIAVSLAKEGARVGLLDADIYGPNIPIMMGLNKLPKASETKLNPGNAHGVEIMSMGYLIPEGEAVVWRGPMIHNAILQLFTEVAWGDLDYMIVDLPPGTGDAQMSLAQNVPLTGGVIVTTPQEVALSDAKRGISAFNKLDVPVIGIIENMSGEIFGSGGGEKAASDLNLDFLGRIPLDAKIRTGSDTGEPIVISEPDSETALNFRSIAKVLAGKISVIQQQKAG